MKFANHGSKLKFKQNKFQITLAVFTKHIKRLRLKILTFCTTILLQV